MKLIDRQVFEAGLRFGTIYSALEDIANPAKRISLIAHFPQNQPANSRTISINADTSQMSPHSISQLQDHIIESIMRLREGMIERLTFTNVKRCALMDFIPRDVNEHKTHGIWETNDFHLLHCRLTETLTGKEVPEGPQLFIWTDSRGVGSTVMIVDMTYADAFDKASSMIKRSSASRKQFPGWGTHEYHLTTKPVGEPFIIEYADE
jgi:hypothetical protein